MSRIAPWSGWIGGIAGWFVSQQFGANFVQLDCDAADLAPMLLVGLLGAALAAGGGVVSWMVWRRRPEGAEPQTRSRGFIAGTAALAALVFALAIAFQTTSSLVIPQCHA